MRQRLRPPDRFATSAAMAGVTLSFGIDVVAVNLRTTTDASRTFPVNVPARRGYAAIDGNVAGLAVHVGGPAYMTICWATAGPAFPDWGRSDAVSFRPVGGATVALGGRSMVTGPDEWYRIDLGCVSTIRSTIPAPPSCASRTPPIRQFSPALGRGIHRVHRLDAGLLVPRSRRELSTEPRWTFALSSGRAGPSVRAARRLLPVGAPAQSRRSVAPRPALVARGRTRIPRCDGPRRRRVTAARSPSLRHRVARRAGPRHALPRLCDSVRQGRAAERRGNGRDADRSAARLPPRPPDRRRSTLDSVVQQDALNGDGPNATATHHRVADPTLYGPFATSAAAVARP